MPAAPVKTRSAAKTEQARFTPTDSLSASTADIEFSSGTAAATDPTAWRLFFDLDDQFGLAADHPPGAGYDAANFSFSEANGLRFGSSPRFRETVPSTAVSRSLRQLVSVEE